jgi:hypothetical protein
VAAPRDRVQVLKNESPSEGGTEDDLGFPVTINPNTDAPSVAGVFVQSPHPSTSKDELVYLTRDASGNMIFRDNVDGTERTLTELLGEQVVDLGWRRHFLTMGG